MIESVEQIIIWFGYQTFDIEQSNEHRPEVEHNAH